MWSFTLKTETAVELKIYDIFGKYISTLVNGRRKAGRHQVLFDARGLAAGLYVCRLTAGRITYSRRVALVK